MRLKFSYNLSSNHSSHNFYILVNCDVITFQDRHHFISLSFSFSPVSLILPVSLTLVHLLKLRERERERERMSEKQVRDKECTVARIRQCVCDTESGNMKKHKTYHYVITNIDIIGSSSCEHVE